MDMHQAIPDPFGQDPPDRSPLSDSNRPGLFSKTFEVVKAEAESATMMGSPVDPNAPFVKQDSTSPRQHLHGDVTPTKSSSSQATRIDRIRDSLESSIG